MPIDEDQLIDDVLTGQISRRDLIKRLLAAGVSVSAIGGLLAETGLGSVADAASYVDEARLAVKKGGTLRVGYVVPATDIDPVSMYNEGAILTAQMSLEYLTYPRQNFTLAPKLALSWSATRSDLWTFKLRQGVKWHDGKPFTADDVVYTFNYLTDPKTNSAALSAFKGILSKGGTRKVDAHTVAFHLDRGYIGFPYLVSALTYNAAILPKGYKVGDFIKGGVGTGAYILTGYTPKAQATYKKNPHYWHKGLPYVNGVQLRFYGDATAVSLALQAGDIDVYPNVTYAGNQALFHNSKIKVLKHASSSYRELHMRVDTPPFNDKRVRQAVALSLDRPKLVTGVLGGLGTVGNDHVWAPVLPLSAATKAIPQRTRNIAKAKQLLAAAGHAKGINITLTYEQYLEIAQYAVTVKSMLAPAGINVTLHGEDQTTYYGTPPNEPWLDVPMGIVDWAPRGVPSQDITPAYLTGAVWNSAHWSNKTFDRLVADADKQLSAAKRNADYVKAATIMHDEVPAVIAYWLYDMQATRNNVHGLRAAPGPYPDFSAVWIG